MLKMNVNESENENESEKHIHGWVDGWRLIGSKTSLIQLSVQPNNI